MTAEEMRQEFNALYNMMASSTNVAYMHVFGSVHKEMFLWFVQNKPDLAQEWLDKLESIRWKNYLTPKEAERIVGDMVPAAPWSREQWKTAIEKHGYELEYEPYYNKCALWTTMNMIMSDSSETLGKYIDKDRLFDAVYALAVDKLRDRDGKFNIRAYFGL
jgi:hypothetical protein